MMRIGLIVVLLAAAGAALWALWSHEGRRAGVHVSGDYAGLIGDRLDLRQVPAEEAALVVTLLHRWSNLRHVPDGALCGDACDGGAVLVRVIDLGPGESRKHVFLRTSAFFDLTVSMQDDGANSAGIDCVARVIEAEASVVDDPPLPDCAAEVLGAEGAVATGWSLPFGLGAVEG